MAIILMFGIFWAVMVIPFVLLGKYLIDCGWGFSICVIIPLLYFIVGEGLLLYISGGFN